MSLDLAPSLRAALINDAVITGLISQLNGNPAIFTRVPVPDDAPYPQIVIMPDVSINDFDGLTSRRPEVVRDIMVYGNQPDDYRTVETVGYLLRELFHRNRLSIENDDYDIVQIIATGPNPAPTSDENKVGRMVSLLILLREKP